MKLKIYLSILIRILEIYICFFVNLKFNFNFFNFVIYFIEFDNSTMHELAISLYLPDITYNNK